MLLDIPVHSGTDEYSLSRVKRTWPIALQMSAYGPKQTFHFALHMSAFEGKADMARISHRLLMAQGGHPAVARKLGYA